MRRQTLLAFTLLTTSAFAQAIFTHTASEITQLEGKMLAQAKTVPTGVAFTTVDVTPTSSALVIARTHTGEAELHALFADQIVVHTGTLTLITGGKMLPGRTLPDQPGETRSPGIEGGTETLLHPGDIVHIPANVPHWFKLPAGTTATYIAFKEK